MVDNLDEMLNDVWVYLERDTDGWYQPKTLMKSRAIPGAKFESYNTGTGWALAREYASYTLMQCTIGEGWKSRTVLRCRKTGQFFDIPTQYAGCNVATAGQDPESIHVPLPSLHPDPSPVRRVSPAHGIGVMWAGGLETGRLFNGGL